MAYKKYIIALSVILFGAVSATAVNSLFFHFTGCNFIVTWPFCSYTMGIQKLWQFLVITALLGVISLLGWQWYTLDRSRELLPKRMIQIGLCCVYFLSIFIIPFTSADMRYYFSAGRAVRVSNPYIEQWTLLSTPLASAQSSTTGIMYGPLTIRLFQFFVWVSRDNFFVFCLLWKILMAGVLVAVSFLTVRLNALVRNTGTISKTWLLLQPLFVWEWVVAGHFDGLWIAMMLLSFILAIQNRWVLAAAALTVGVWLKFIPILLFPVFLLWWWQNTTKENARLRITQLVGAMAAVVGITLISWAGLWQGMRVFQPILLQSKWAIQSVFSVVYFTLFPLAQHVFNSQAHWILTRLVQGSLALAVLYFMWPLLVLSYKILSKKYTASPLEYIKTVFIGFTVYLLIWQKSFWPWYVLWLLPLGIILWLQTKQPQVEKIIRWFSVTALLLYIPSIFITSNDVVLWFDYYVVGVLLAYPLYNLRLWRALNYVNS